MTSAPPFVLFGYGALTAHTGAERLTRSGVDPANYTLVGAKFDHLLLRKIGNTEVAGETKLIGERTIDGEQVDIPAQTAVWFGAQSIIR